MLVLFISLFVLALVVLTYIAQLYVMCLSLNWNKWTSAETRDRKCFSMQLILVVGKVDMINEICQMLSFCWKLLSAYFAEKMITKYITKYISNCKVCMD